MRNHFSSRCTDWGWLTCTYQCMTLCQTSFFLQVVPTKPARGRKKNWNRYFFLYAITLEKFIIWVTRGMLLLSWNPSDSCPPFFASLMRPSNKWTKKFWYVHYKELHPSKWYFLWGFVWINLSKPCSIRMISLLLQVVHYFYKSYLCCLCLEMEINNPVDVLIVYECHEFFMSFLLNFLFRKKLS